MSHRHKWLEVGNRDGMGFWCACGATKQVPVRRGPLRTKTPVINGVRLTALTARITLVLALARKQLPNSRVFRRRAASGGHVVIEVQWQFSDDHISVLIPLDRDAFRDAPFAAEQVRRAAIEAGQMAAARRGVAWPAHFPSLGIAAYCKACDTARIRSTQALADRWMYSHPHPLQSTAEGRDPSHVSTL